MIPEIIEEITDGGLPCTPCSASLLDAAKILMPELGRRASKLRKSRHHNALHDLHIIECTISTIEDIIEQNSQDQERRQPSSASTCSNNLQ